MSSENNFSATDVHEMLQKEIVNFYKEMTKKGLANGGGMVIVEAPGNEVVAVGLASKNRNADSLGDVMFKLMVQLYGEDYTRDLIKGMINSAKRSVEETEFAAPNKSSEKVESEPVVNSGSFRLSSEYAPGTLQ